PVISMIGPRWSGRRRMPRRLRVEDPSPANPLRVVKRERPPQAGRRSFFWATARSWFAQPSAAKSSRRAAGKYGWRFENVAYRERSPARSSRRCRGAAGGGPDPYQQERQSTDDAEEDDAYRLLQQILNQDDCGHHPRRA